MGKASSRRRKSGARKARRVKVRSARPRRTTAARGGTTPLARTLLQRLRRHRAALASRLAGLQSEMSRVEKAIAAVSEQTITGPRSRSSRRARGVRAGSLRDHITKFLRSSRAPKSPKQITEGVLKAGYKTKSKHLATAVRNALSKIEGIKKVGFGMYRL
jgi:hypothetical protein